MLSAKILEFQGEEIFIFNICHVKLLRHYNDKGTPRSLKSLISYDFIYFSYLRFCLSITILQKIYFFYF